MTPALPILLCVDAAMVGLIITVQWVVYPGFAYFSSENLLTWHDRYTRRIAYLAAPLMLGQLAGGLNWALTSPGVASMGYLAGILILWGLTLLRFVPMHQQIGRGNADRRLLKRLVRENGVRTALWILLFLWHLAWM